MIIQFDTTPIIVTPMDLVLFPVVVAAIIAVTCMCAAAAFRIFKER